MTTVDENYLRLLNQAKASSGMTLRVIGDRAGLSYQTVSNLVNGVSLGRRENVVALVGAMMPPTSPDAEDLIARYDAQIAAREEARMQRLVGVDTERARARDDSRQALADAIRDLADAVRELAATR